VRGLAARSPELDAWREQIERGKALHVEGAPDPESRVDDLRERSLQPRSPSQEPR
jgi:hypothetical protein